MQKYSDEFSAPKKNELTPLTYMRKHKGGIENISTLVTFKAIDPPCPPY